MLQITVLVCLTALALVGYTNPALITNWFESKEFVSAPNAKISQVAFQSSRGDQPDRATTSPYRIDGGDCVLVARLNEDSPDDFFNGDALAVMRSVAEGLQAMPQVAGIRWLDNIPDFNLFGLSGTLLPSENASARRLAMARKDVLSNPLAVGQLISSDGTTMLMLIEIDWFFVRSDEAITEQIRQKAESITNLVLEQRASATGKLNQSIDSTNQLSSDSIEFLLTGEAPLHLMTANNHVRDTVKYQLIGYSIMLLSALFLFRGFSAVCLVALAPALGVFWTLGMLRFFDLQDNPFNDIIVPVLIALVGLADAVHLMVEVRQQRAGGLPARTAGRQAVARVGFACLLTSVTTGIGFVSLTWAHHEIVRQFGWCCVIGVSLTFISVLTVIPLGCRSPLGRRLHIGLGKSTIDRQLKRIGPVVDWVLKRDKFVSRIAIALTVGLVAVSLQLEPDEKRYSGLSESGEAAIALRHLDRSLGGLEFGSVDIWWTAETSEAEVLQVIQKSGDILRDEPLMGNPVGLHRLLAALPGDGDPAERMSLLDLLPPSLKRAFYRPEDQHAAIQFRIQDLGIAAYGPTFTRVEERLRQLDETNSEFSINLAGDAVWRWKNVYQVVTDLTRSLGTASIVIGIMMTLVYRSLRIGLISIVPNVLPLAATGAILYATGQYLEITIVCVFTICLGIAVDDSIHFLSRYQEESRGGGKHDEIIRRAFTGVGSALLMTTIVLVAGLGSAILGDSRDARIFGIMGCLTLSSALLADILLLPALLHRFAKPRTTASSPRIH